ncbi:MAG TPA: carboxypeptidase regulatory-like domain-containing protein [Myxococcota bacterium]|jgi:outer membrane protein OmpA-like peptidoglycan-associated protein|nr:carboxypeptidase regulatory-like domain-containing protein [Myxococcota bacterium]
MASAPIPLAPGGVQAAIGTPVTIQIPVRVFTVRLTGILFDTDKCFLLPPGLKSIRGFKQIWAAHPDIKVLVVGHADKAGAPDHNQKLSERRAEAIRSYLSDDQDGWLRFYSPGVPPTKLWGAHEDQEMLSHLGFADVRSYQESKGLAADGSAGPDTRRALITDYMNQDQAEKPPTVDVTTHGCGESHPEFPTADGVADERNRRVEIFLFEEAVTPAPVNPCPQPGGCGEHTTWKGSSREVIDLGADLSTVVVTVTDETGAPVPAAEVHLSGFVSRDAQTDPTGVAQIAEALPTSYEVFARKTGFQSASQKIAVPAGSTVPVALTLKAAPGNLVVVVRDSGGVLLPGAAVAITGPAATTAAKPTGASGDALFGPVPKGAYQIAVTAALFVPGAAADQVQPDQTTTTVVTLIAVPTQLIVRVLDPGGGPAAAANVTSLGPTPGSGVSDASGVVDLGLVQPGAYTITATKTGFGAKTESVAVTPTGAPPPSAPAPTAGPGLSPASGTSSSLVGSPVASGGGGAGAAGGSGTTTAPTPSAATGGGGKVVDIQLLAVAPLIKKLEGTAKPDPRAKLPPVVSDFVYFGQGEPVFLFWEISGDADKITIDPGGLDFTDKTSALLDPATNPPNANGKYVLNASFKGLASTPAEIAVGGIVEYAIEPSDNPFITPPPKLFAKDQKTEVPKIDGVAGSYHKAPHNGGNLSFGECSVRTDLSLRWRVVGEKHIRVGVDIDKAADDSKPKPKPITLVEDVTDRTRLVDSITGKAGSGRFSFKDESVILLHADLAISREGGGPLGSSVLLVREHIPHPGVSDFFAEDKGARVAPGAKVSDWANVSFGWKLFGNFQQNRVEIELHDKPNQKGTLLGKLVVNPAKNATGAKVIVSPVPSGDVFATLTLINTFNKPAELPPKTTHIVVPAAAPKVHKLKVIVFSNPSGAAAGVDVTAIDKDGTNHKGVTDAKGEVEFSNVAEGDVTVIAHKPPSKDAFKSIDLKKDDTLLMSLDDPKIPQFDVSVDLGKRLLLAPLVVSHGKFGTSKVEFKLKYSERDEPGAATAVEMKVLSAGGATIHTEKFTSGPILIPGEHVWEWDGWSDAGVLDTALLKEKGVKVQATVSRAGAKDSVGTLTLENEGHDLDFIDLLIVKSAKTIAVTAHFLPETRSLPIVGAVDTSDFSKVITYIEEGVKKHWSRTITVDSEVWTVSAVAKIRPTSPFIRITVVPPVPPTRSCNPGMFADMSFVVFQYEPPKSSVTGACLTLHDDDNRETGAHEIGHLIIAQRLGLPFGPQFSAGHKGTSTLLGDKIPSAVLPYPSTGEIDIMRYWDPDPTWPPFAPARCTAMSATFARLKLIEDDMKDLLNFAKVEFDD